MELEIKKYCENGATCTQIAKHLDVHRTIARDALMDLVGRGQLRIRKTGRIEVFYVPEVWLNLAAHDPFNRTGVYA